MKSVCQFPGELCKELRKYASAYLKRIIIMLTNAVSLANVITCMADVPEWIHKYDRNLWRKLIRLFLIMLKSDIFSCFEPKGLRDFQIIKNTEI